MFVEDVSLEDPVDGGDGLQHDGSVAGQHLELLLGDVILEVLEGELHLLHVEVQVPQGVLLSPVHRVHAGSFVAARLGGVRGARALAAASARGPHLRQDLEEILLEGAGPSRQLPPSRLSAAAVRALCGGNQITRDQLALHLISYSTHKLVPYSAINFTL